MKEKKFTVYQLCFMALMAAVTCILAPLSIPIGPIPISLTNLVVYFTVYVIGLKAGTCSYCLYVLLGVVGLPVFSGYVGGPAKIAGPTGGYIVGYIVCAWVTGIIVKYTKGKIYQIALAMVVGVALCYVLGTIWFMILSGNPLKVSLGFCVFPFLPGDAIKIILASTISAKLRQGVSNIYELNPCKISTNTTGEIAK